MKPLSFAFLLVAALAAACAPAPQKMSESVRKSIRYATVRSDAPMPATLYYVAPGDSIGPVFGALGAIATEPAREESRQKFRAFLEKNGIAIERIVLEEFSAALRSSGKLLIADKPGPGVATIRITIRQYGLTVPTAFNSKLVPLLSVACEMTDASGKTVWSASDRLSALGNPVEALPAEKAGSDPRAVENAWRAAARHIAANIVKEL